MGIFNRLVKTIQKNKEMDRLTEATTFEPLVVRLDGTKIDIKTNKIERFMVMGTYTKEYFDTLFGVVKSIREIFADGYQWWNDSIALGALVPKFFKLATGTGKLKDDIKTLDIDQKKAIIKQYVPLGLDALWFDNNINDGSLGITKISLVLDDIACLTDDGIGIASDGKVDIDDAKYLPDIAADIWGIIHTAGDALEECKRLDKPAVISLIVVLMSKIFKYVN